MHETQKKDEKMKYRIHAKNGNVTIKAKPSFGEKINERELDYLLNHTVPGFFPVTYDGKKQVTYEAACSMSLEKYLKEIQLGEKSFWRIMEQMLDVAIAAKGRGLYPAHLQVKTDMIFIDADSLQMYFVYPPVTGEKDVTDDLFAVIHDMIYQELKKRGGKGEDYLMDFQSYLQQGDYRLEHVRQYIARAASGGQGRGAAGVPQQIKHEQEDDLEQYTVMLGSGSKADPAREVKPKGMELTRLRTNERVSFPDEVVRIGRSSQNVYCITGNASIGRNHAALVRRGNDCYLKDLGSVNGTFVNGRRLGENQACRLQSKDRIQLADEEFVFEYQP